MCLFVVPSDINECSPVNPCTPGGDCVNADGYYDCTCYHGYQWVNSTGPECKGS